MNSTLGSVVPLAMFIFGCQPNNGKKNIAKGITDRSFYQSIVQITTDVHRLTQPFLKSHNLSDNHLTSPQNTQPLLNLTCSDIALSLLTFWLPWNPLGIWTPQVNALPPTDWRGVTRRTEKKQLRRRRRMRRRRGRRRMMKSQKTKEEEGRRSNVICVAKITRIISVRKNCQKLLLGKRN